MFNGKGAKIIAVGSSFFELTGLHTGKKKTPKTKTKLYVVDYPRKIIERGPVSAVNFSLPRALQRLSDSFTLKVHTKACTALTWWLPRSLWCHLLGLAHCTPATHLCICRHWETPGTCPPQGFWFTSFCPKPFFFRYHFWVFLSKAESSSLSLILSIPLLGLIFLQAFGLKTYPVLLMACLRHARLSPCEGRNFCLFSSLFYPCCLKPAITQGVQDVFADYTNEWRKVFFEAKVGFAREVFPRVVGNGE